MTLVEAMVGVALLGTLLAGSLIAQGKFNRQAGLARRTVDACRVADDLLEGLWRQKDALQKQTEGDVPGHPGWRWRKVDVHREEKVFTELEAKVIAIEVFENGQDSQGGNNQPAMRVELLMPSDERIGAPG